MQNEVQTEERMARLTWDKVLIENLGVLCDGLFAFVIAAVNFFVFMEWISYYASAVVTFVVACLIAFKIGLILCYRMSRHVARPAR